jgi:hypothetical protein
MELLEGAVYDDLYQLIEGIWVTVMYRYIAMDWIAIHK